MCKVLDHLHSAQREREDVSRGAGSSVVLASVGATVRGACACAALRNASGGEARLARPACGHGCASACGCAIPQAAAGAGSLRLAGHARADPTY